MYMNMYADTFTDKTESEVELVKDFYKQQVSLSLYHSVKGSDYTSLLPIHKYKYVLKQMT